MNHHSISLMILAGALCFCSCSKSNNTKAQPQPIDSPVVYPNYTKLTVGNYWVYEEYQIDSNGNAASMGMTDSSYVEKDTVINNNTYHKYVDISLFLNTTSVSYLRDSLSYTVNSSGLIVFSSDDFSHIFREIPFTNPNAGVTDTVPVFEQMAYKDSSVTVPAGTFITSTFRRLFDFTSSSSVHYRLGNREYDYKYSRNMGIVSETMGFYTNIPGYMEKRLIRFHVQIQ